MNLAFEVYRLTPDDLERFDFVYTRKPSFAEMIEDSAAMWRDCLRLICATQDECRWMFLRDFCPQHKTLFPQNAEMQRLSMGQMLVERLNGIEEVWGSG